MEVSNDTYKRKRMCKDNKILIKDKKGCCRILTVMNLDIFAIVETFRFSFFAFFTYRQYSFPVLTLINMGAVL